MVTVTETTMQDKLCKDNEIPSWGWAESHVMPSPWKHDITAVSFCSGGLSKGGLIIPF